MDCYLALVQLSKLNATVLRADVFDVVSVLNHVFFVALSTSCASAMKQGKVCCPQGSATFSPTSC